MTVTILDSWAVVATSINDAGTAFPVSAGDDRILLFKFSLSSAVGFPLTSVSYGGQALTQVEAAATTSGRDLNSSLWILDEAGIAAASDTDFDWTPTSGTSATRMVAGSYQDVDQVDPTVDSDVTTDIAGGTPSTPALTTVDGGRTVGTFSNNRGTDDTPDPDVTWNNMTELNEVINPQVYSSVADAANTGTSFDPDLSATVTQSSHYIGVALRPAVVGIDVDAALAGFLPTVSATIETSIDVNAALAGFLPAASATIETPNDVAAALAGFLPSVSASMDISIEAQAALAGFLPQVAAAMEQEGVILPIPSDLFGGGHDDMAVMKELMDQDERDIKEMLPAIVASIMHKLR
ncbi:MAG: hypothetical protein ACR2QH_15090 [Geminicoccaceae bacterium]